MATQQTKKRTLRILVLEPDHLFEAPLETCLSEVPGVAPPLFVRDVPAAQRTVAQEAVHAIYIDPIKVSGAVDFIGATRRECPEVVFVLYVRQAALTKYIDQGRFPPEWCMRFRHYLTLDKGCPLADFDLAVRDSVKAVLGDLGLRQSDLGDGDEGGVPQVIGGKYLVLGSLGSGGMGEVLKARQMGTEQICAVKLVQPAISQECGHLLRKEAMLTAKIGHPNVVRVLDFDHDRRTDKDYLVTSFLDGMTLHGALAGQPTGFPTRRALSIAKQIASGLMAAHSVGVLHRDLKPGNIMLQILPGVGDHVVVFDFGLGKLVDASGRGPASLFGGTMGYGAPEQFSMGAEIGPFTDVYALAVCTCEMLSGRKFWQTGISAVRAWGDKVTACVAKATASSPQERTRYPSQFIDELAAALPSA